MTALNKCACKLLSNFSCNFVIKVTFARIKKNFFLARFILTVSVHVRTEKLCTSKTCDVHDENLVKGSQSFILPMHKKLSEQITFYASLNKRK